jgi:hypothetical protein
MVASAQQEQVFRRGLAAVDPVLDVMHIAPRRRTITAGEAAAAVAPHESAPERAGDDPGPTTDVERFRASREDRMTEASHAVQGDPAVRRDRRVQVAAHVAKVRLLPVDFGLGSLPPMPHDGRELAGG